MTNQQLIKSAHIWFLTVLLGGGLLAVAGKTGIQGQNSNQNSNSNSTQNSNQNSNSNSTANSNSQNGNANRTGNRNSNTGAMGEQAGMANMSSQDRDFLMDDAMG